MARLILLLFIGVGLFLFVNWLFRQPGKVRMQVVLAVLALVLLALVLTGRAHWIAAVFAALLPFLRGLLNLVGLLPLFKRVMSGRDSTKPNSSSGSGQTSTVQGKYIRMTLDHDSGDIDGEVLAGQFQGKVLSELGLDALLLLLEECRDDDESVSLLEAYLERMHADEWRQGSETREERHSPGASGELSREEALQILGLEGEVSDEEIIDAHRRLMLKLHPDRGGSAYLAAKINQAKDKLLGG